MRLNRAPPEGFSGSAAASLPPGGSLQKPGGISGLFAAKRRVVVLYEQYIHLQSLQQVWASPVSEKPELEPCFAAAFHGIELCFLLLAEFLCDQRTYVAKRPRVELVAKDIQTQCILLTEIVDCELEEDEVAPRTSLTQDFPFDACPPTTDAPSTSPGLARLIDAVLDVLPRISNGERNSLVKVVLNISNTFEMAFGRWTVGLGIEHQLNELRVAVGLSRLPTFDARTHHLDYSLLVCPEVAVSTLTGEQYTHKEDFFFRTIHLGIECWAFIAIHRLNMAKQLTREGQWHVAAARMAQAARILHYLGEHVLMLTSMNLRDYLLLKVELQGTSGEGSKQVRMFRGLVKSLLTPLAAALVPAEPGEGVEEEALQAALLQVYESPDARAGLYNYAKGLEEIESALLGGFYYSHFILATTVLGTAAKGTMDRAVASLKATYETPVFPTLDAVRSLLGAKMDQELNHVKGRLLNQMEAKHAQAPDGLLLPGSPVTVLRSALLRQRSMLSTTSSAASNVSESVTSFTG
ncbi:hypothetical protein WJX72_003475 [[Myrmecia] bisecta]|uniref:Nematode resistance protein-like HSPRO1 N-terminal domain-containing protein n=1 Tax=[Myrmecia] bisecta TaxID=41462 RepID=A0AAW1QEM1_9CHLO